MSDATGGLAEVQERLEAAGVPEDEALREALGAHRRLERGEGPEEVADDLLLRRRAEERRREDPAYQAL